jgi:hypothetical protein
MPTVRFRLTTDLPRDLVLNALIDFSDQRPNVWPKIDRAHFRVYAQGPDWADVMEGNVLASERNRYEWNTAAGEVNVTTVESDTWAAGSHWQYRLLSTPGGGTDVDVTVVRKGQGARGMLIGAAISWFGRRMLRADMEKVLARLR